MLELDRDISERIVIGKDIILTVLGIHHCPIKSQVRIGIEAPEHIDIWRTELCWHTDKGWELKKHKHNKRK